MARHYLDHASTSPPRPVVVEAVTQWLSEPLLADPGRVHTEGRMARAALEEARASIARLLGARPREVVLTSGASEAIAAVAWGAAERGRHAVVPAIEHSAVRLSAEQHFEVTTVGCDRTGMVDVDALIAAIRPDTAIVHLQWANHEVGTLQPVTQAVEACRERGVLIHVDAAAAAGHVPIDFRELGADLLSVSAHKMGGPPGIGALLVRRGLRLRPLIVGGDQERARRAGLESLPLAMGWAALADTIDVAAEAEVARRQCDALREAATRVNGVEVLGHPHERLPHLVCLGVAGVEPQGVLLGLDQAGIAAHSGSACATEGLEPSPVLEAMGVDAHRSLRLSVGWSTTGADVDAFASAFGPVVERLRALAQSSPQ